MRSLVGEEKNMPPRHTTNSNELRLSSTVELTIHCVAVTLRGYVDENESSKFSLVDNLEYLSFLSLTSVSEQLTVLLFDNIQKQ